MASSFEKVMRLLCEALSITEATAAIKARGGRNMPAQTDTRVFEFSKDVLKDLLGKIKRQTEKQRSRAIVHNRELQQLRQEVIVSWQEQLRQKSAEIEAMKAAREAEQQQANQRIAQALLKANEA